MWPMLVVLLMAILGSSVCDSSWRAFQTIWSDVVGVPYAQEDGPSILRIELERLEQRIGGKSPRCESIVHAAAALTGEYTCLERPARDCNRGHLDSLVARVIHGGEPDLLRLVHPISWDLVPAIDSVLLRKQRRAEDLRKTLWRSALTYGVRPYLIELCASRPFSSDPGTWEHCANYVYEYRGDPGWKTYREVIRRAAPDSKSRQEIDRLEPVGKIWLRESLHGGVSMLGPEGHR